MPKKFSQIDFIKLCKKVHQDKYIYSKTNYINANLKIIITCSEHGDFEQLANDHKRGRGCYQCGINKIKQQKTYTNDKFKEVASEIHNNEYNYSLTEYTNHNDKLKIICKKHGIFYQFAYNHLIGAKCKKCSIQNQKKTIITNNNIKTDAWKYTVWEEKGKKSKNFDSYKCYIIKCWNDDEQFYKIGKTFRKVEDRFYKFKYNWSIINVFKGNAEEISKLETTLKKVNKPHKYVPKIKFGGNYECFTKIKKMENKKLEKVIWEGWRIIDFIDDLEPMFELVMAGGSWQKPFQSKEELKKWCMDTQPYYKKHIPGVFNHFKQKAKL